MTYTLTTYHPIYKKHTVDEVSRFTDFVFLVKKARKFATEAHKGQYRNGFGCDGQRLEYISHPIAVGKILHKVKSSHKLAELIAVCMLHDTVEDCKGVTVEVIREEFGDLIASLVEELTSDPKGVESLGKQKYLINKMLNMSTWGLSIKLADRLHNLSDVDTRIAGGKKSDLKWVKKYCTQTKNIVDSLEEGRSLTKTHKKLIKEIKKTIKSGLNVEI
jgi:(p)ppGpp synthase/HD superfamily hydrolase